MIPAAGIMVKKKNIRVVDSSKSYDLTMICDFIQLAYNNYTTLSAYVQQNLINLGEAAL